LKVTSGLFKRKAAASNGHRNALDPRQWLIVGVDLEWPPPAEPNVAPADRWVLQAEGWTDPREGSELARELAWLSRIGAEDLPDV
jgi:hypothetical protein